MNTKVKINVELTVEEAKQIVWYLECNEIHAGNAVNNLLHQLKNELGSSVDNSHVTTEKFDIHR